MDHCRALALIALALSIAQLIASRMVWPDAGRPPEGLTIGTLAEHWVALVLVLTLGLCMLAFDLYSLIRVGEIPRTEMEKYFDQAEYSAPLQRRPMSSASLPWGMSIRARWSPRKFARHSSTPATSSTRRYGGSACKSSLRFSFGLSLWLTWRSPNENCYNVV